uniref:Prokineticin domain-containing protein n=1 Tax=Biomphalaria glabrata TaxID=6526 RepID=A0A2C9KKR0_BIOGL
MFGKITMTTILLIFLCLAVCFVQQAEGSVGMNCNETSQCEPGECCQKSRLYPIVSRRDADIYDDNPKLPGVCAQYKRLGATCITFDKRNGYCDCEPGTECQTHKLTLKNRRFSRSLPQWSVMKCSKTETPTKITELS